MKPGPAVSVAIRAWRRTTLDHAIRSVLQQTRCDWELVVYDDGDLADAVARHDDVRIRRVPAAPGLDAAGRFLAALAECRAPFVAFLDDDDRYVPDALRRLLAGLQAHPGAGSASGPYEQCRAAEPQDADACWPARETQRRMLAEGWVTPTSTLMFRRAALDEVLARWGMPAGVAPDSYLSLQLAAAGHAHVRLVGRVCDMSAPPGRISAASSGARYALASYQRASIADPALEEAWRRRVAHARLVLAARLLREQQAPEARRLLLALREESPQAFRAHRIALGVAARLPRAGRLALDGSTKLRALWRRVRAPATG